LGETSTGLSGGVGSQRIVQTTGSVGRISGIYNVRSDLAGQYVYFVSGLTFVETLGVRENKSINATW
jgi:hypothetical protein